MRLPESHVTGPLISHVIFTILLPLAHAAAKGRPIVLLKEGYVQGFDDVVNGKKVDIFYGMPFAKPPIGDLRFKPPIEPNKWTGRKDATRLPNSCQQGMDTTFGNFTGSNMWNPNTEVSEDCLYLNVWTPKTRPPFENKSVIVWIYGGGFFSGTSTLEIYDAKYLASQHDVVVVSIQYRVSVLGFLTLDTTDAPGNIGLLDQMAALQWVQNNIEKFGGNKNDVTLMGESAGGVSVGLFLICNVCSLLFHKAILQSGSPAAGWAVLSKDEMVRRSHKLAVSVKCMDVGQEDVDDDKVLECLKGKNASQLIQNEWTVLGGGIIQFPFVPIIDGVFIRQDPTDMLNKGIFNKVPILLGSNENEATFFMTYHQDYDRDSRNALTPKKYEDVMNDMFSFYPHYPVKLNGFGRESIQFQYRNWLNPNDGIENRKSSDRAVSDAHFVCAVNTLAQAYAREGQKVFYYWFNQRWSANPWPEWMGVLHADEIWFTFGHPFNYTHSFTEAERTLSRKMMSYWTNFAKTGDPNTERVGGVSSRGGLEVWPAFQHKEQSFLTLSADAITSGNNQGRGPRSQECAFWDIYLPKLIEETADISEAEQEWKREFHAWKTRYIVDWKTQFDNFLYNYQKRMGNTCNGKP